MPQNDSLYIYPPVISQTFPFYIELQVYNEIEEIFPTHWHEHFEMIFMLEGKISLTCNGQLIEAVKGDLLIINPNDVHYLYSQSDSVKYYCIVFNLSLLNSALINNTEFDYLLPIAKNQLVFTNHLTYNNQMLGYVKSLYNEYVNRDNAYEMAIKAQVYLILTSLLRMDCYNQLSTTGYEKRRTHIETIKKILLYVEENYDQEIKVQTLAKEFGMSYHHLCHVFKDYTNKTLIQYLHEIRIDKSMHLLESTDLSITEIAHEVGFGDANYFSRVFKKIQHITPRMYLKNVVEP